MDKERFFYDVQDILQQIGEYSCEGIYIFKSRPDLIEWAKKLIKESLQLDFTVDEVSHKTKVIIKLFANGEEL